MSDLALEVAISSPKVAPSPKIAQNGISKIKQDRREILLLIYEIRVREQEYDVRFCTGSNPNFVCRKV